MQISDTSALEAIIDAVIAQNPKQARILSCVCPPTALSRR